MISIFFIQKNFSRTSFTTHKPSNLSVNLAKSTKCNTKSLKSLGPHISKYLPQELKSETNVDKFKEYINQWLLPIAMPISFE